eukprot:15329767-Alexandrium_andersonii.AAC.1
MSMHRFSQQAFGSARGRTPAPLPQRRPGAKWPALLRDAESLAALDGNGPPEHRDRAQQTLLRQT